MLIIKLLLFFSKVIVERISFFREASLKEKRV